MVTLSAVSWSDVGGAAAVVAVIIALATVLNTTRIVRQRAAWRRLYHARYRSVGRVLVDLTPPEGATVTAPRWMQARALRSQFRNDAKKCFEREPRNAAAEIDWLRTAVSGWAMEGNLPFTYRLSHAQLLTLSDAYLQLAQELSVHTWLNRDQPAHEDEIVLARAVRSLLDLYAQRIDGFQPLSETVSCQTPSWRIGLYGMEASWPAALDMVVSWRRTRYVPDVEPAVAANGDECDLRSFPVHGAGKRAVRELLSRAHAYDGVLPAIADLRVERDPRSGRDRLHVAILEATYSSVRALSAAAADGVDLHAVSDEDRGTRDDERGQNREDQPRLGQPPTVATISLLPITRDGYVLLARRSSSLPEYPDTYAPAVNGNLDIPDPRRKNEDADVYGVPDFKLAVVREAKEEMNLAVALNDVHLRGVGRISTRYDANTWVIAMTAFVPRTVDEVAEQAAVADVIEGRWEVGDLLAIPVPRTIRDAEAILGWVLSNSQEFMPHVAVSLAFYLNALLSLDLETIMSVDIEEAMVASGAVQPTGCRVVPVELR